MQDPGLNNPPVSLLIDGRDMQPPDPLEKAVAALETLPPGGELRMLLVLFAILASLCYPPHAVAARKKPPCLKGAEREAKRVAIDVLKSFDQQSTSASVRELIANEQGKTSRAKKGESYVLFEIANQDAKSMCVFILMKTRGCKVIQSGPESCNV